jgi:hypothetical protein
MDVVRHGKNQINTVNMKKYEFSQSVKIPPEIDEIFLTPDNEAALIEISEQLHLSEQDRKLFLQCSQKYLYWFETHVNVIIRELEQKLGSNKEIIKTLSVEFKDKVQTPLKNALKKYYSNIDRETEHVFFESGHLKITDKYIHYSYYPDFNPLEPISSVSNITCYSNFWKTRYTVTYEVWIPSKGRWGTVERPGSSFTNEKEAFTFMEILKRAVACGSIRNV